MKKTTEEIKRNKELIKEYPFLLPRNRWTGKVVEDYDYSYTEIDAMPIGWRKAFGDQMLKELKEALGDFADKYRITQIKEKYGELRWYDFGNTKEGFEVISKYQKLSNYTCIVCGKPATKVTTGWISPFCDDCIGNRQYTDIDKEELEELGNLINYVYKDME